jgi:hypothetical protein
MLKITAVVLLSTWAWFGAAQAIPSSVPVINDDYARARAEAVRDHVPVFVEVWAPW